MIDIIPAIDLIDGKCVRLSQGDYKQKKIYNENPLEVAKEFEDAGIKRLHLVDLDGAKARHIVNHKVLESIASKTNLIIDFGGGLKTDKDLDIAFSSGASMITGGSIAVKSPDIFVSWLGKYGSEKIILGSDVKDKKISVTGWTEDTDINLMDFLQDYIKKGVTKTICTDISKDGMLEGAAIDLYKDILAKFPGLYLVASGGVESMKCIKDLDRAGIPAVITGKAIYEGRISMKEIAEYLV
jgi:phosphoribosylformimino-5-aminoimidazole carboxamide ribotide isomerase